jgi:hypothetical protein
MKMKYSKLAYDPELESRFEERQRALGRRPDTASTEEAPAASTSGTSLLSAADAAAADELLLGFDALGNELHLAQFRARGWALFGALSHPTAAGRSLIAALSAPANSEIAEGIEVGIPAQRLGEVRSWALAHGRDPSAVVTAEIAYSAALLAARRR